MSKVSVDRELLERIEQWVQEDCTALEELQAVLAQPAEALIYAPVEPSLEMQNAGWREIAEQGVDPEELDVASIYHAMLAPCPTTI